MVESAFEALYVYSPLPMDYLLFYFHVTDYCSPFHFSLKNSCSISCTAGLAVTLSTFVCMRKSISPSYLRNNFAK